LIHLIKLSVGVRDIAHLDALQAARLAVDPPLRHQTRNSPKRAEELCAGGSIYWVIGGVVLVRQRLLDIIEDHWDDGTRCAGLVLDPTLVRVQARAMKAFQGWRYLQPADAPADITASGGMGGDEIPDEMRRALAALALI
jgi:hypothetical protein